MAKVATAYSPEEPGVAGTKTSSTERLSTRRTFYWPRFAPVWTEEGAHKGRPYV